VPKATPLKLIVSTDPDEPLKPGRGKPPAKCIVPAEFENSSFGQATNIDELVSKDEIANLVLSKVR
jgi:hypothetical protein